MEIQKCTKHHICFCLENRLDKAEAENAELKNKLAKAVEALTIYSRAEHWAGMRFDRKIVFIRTEGDGYDLARQTLIELSAGEGEK